MDWQNPPQDAIVDILKQARTVAMVGLSPKPERESYDVAKYLMAAGYDVIPVNPMEKEILGQKSYPDLKSIDRNIDVVDVFRKAEATPEIVREAIAAGIKVVWLQLDIVSEESYRIARDAGITIVMNRCMRNEHSNLEG